MVDKEQLISIFCNTVDIVPPSPDGVDDNSVFLGFMEVADCEAGFDAVVKAYCKVVDNMLATIPMTDLQRLQMLFLRPFSFDEFLLLFDKNIRHVDFARYPIFSTLLVTSEDDRRLFTHLRSPDRHQYHNRHSQHLRVHNKSMYQFLYDLHDKSTDK